MDLAHYNRRRTANPLTPGSKDYVWGNTPEHSKCQQEWEIVEIKTFENNYAFGEMGKKNQRHGLRHDTCLEK